MLQKKERLASQHSGIVLPKATIHTIVTNSSQPLMESIKPCKYLQDKRASRQSIPIYRTMEGSTVAVFQVRKIHSVSFEKKTNAETPFSLSLIHSLPFHHSDPCFSTTPPTPQPPNPPPRARSRPNLTSPAAPLSRYLQPQGVHPASYSERQLLKKAEASGCDRPLKAGR